MLVEIHLGVKLVIAVVAPWLAVAPRGPLWATGLVPLLSALWLLTFPPLYAQGLGVPLVLVWFFGLALAAVGLGTLRQPPSAGPVLSPLLRLLLGLALAGLGLALYRASWL